MTITARNIIDLFQRMYADGWGYIPATAGILWTQAKQDATTDKMARKYGQRWVGHMVCDCSGAFVYAYHKNGMSIYHGSNRIARSYVVELLPVDQAKPGMAAFKARKPGEQLYDLPSQYRQGGSNYNGDLNDYYHIGLVDEDPAYVLNSQSTATGFQRSKIKDGWDAVGYLKAVDYKKGVEPMQMLYQATVYSVNGKPVNLRKEAGTAAKVIRTVPVGTVVDVLEEADANWDEIRVGNDTGYMMRPYLVPVQDDQTTQLRALISEARQKLDEADRLLGGM